MPLSYRDILDQYDAQQEAGATTETLPQWSSRMNTLTGTDLYSAGYHDNWVKRASVGIDRLLEKTGAPEVGAEVGRAVGGLVGQPEVGEETGRGLPRMLVNLAPMAIPGAGVPAIAARVGLTGALAGAETYTATDSPLAGVISGATFAAMPNVAQAAEEAVVKRLVARGAAPLTQKIGGIIGGQAGALGTMTAGQVGTQLATGQEVTNPLSPEGATALAISQLPFAAIHLGSRALGLGKPAPDIQKMVELARSKTELAAASQEHEQKTPIEQTDEVKQPLELDPIIAEQTAAILSRVRGEQLEIKNNPNLTDEDKVRETNARLDEEARVRRIHEPPADGVFGNTILPDSPRQEVLGRQLKINKDGTWRAVLVSDDLNNPEALRGKIVGYSTKGETPPASGFQTQETGVQRFNLPETQWWSFTKTPEEWSKKYPPREQGFGVTKETPQVPTEQLLGAFPTQPELTPQALSEHLNELRNIEAETSQAQTPAELQQAVVKLHGVQGETDTSLTNDTSLNVAQERALNAGVKPVDAAKAAVATEIKKTQKKIQSELPTPEEYGRIAEELGAGGFTIIDASHVSHGDSTDIAEQPGVEIVNEAAHNAVRNPAVSAAFESWPEKGEHNFGKDVGDFNDLVDKFGGLQNVKDNLKVAAEYLGVGRGFGSRDPEDVAEYLERPHVQEMFRVLDTDLMRQQLTNRALVPPSVTRREMFVPTEQERMKISELGIDQGGQGMLTYLQAHPNPFINALGKDLSKFWDSAQRVDSAIQNIEGGRTIRRQGDRFLVEFTPGLLYADEGPQGFLVAHELVHGLTMAELDKPTNRAVYDKLDDLRIALIKKLPKDMQTSLSRADETDWYGRHARGESHEPLHEGATLKEEQVLYGLTNLHEFVSQGLSSEDMRQFLLKQKTGNETWFSRFTNLIKTVLGVSDNISGTAFEEFLSQTDQLLERGNYLANLRNFGDRYFQNMGMRDDFARQNTNRAVGLLMGMDERTTSENLLDSLRMGAGAVRSPEWTVANRAAIRMFQRGEEERDGTVNVIGEHGYQANLVGLYDFAHDLLRGDAPKEAVDLLPSAATSLVFETARDAKNILGVLDAAARDSNKGLVNLRDPEMVKGPVKEALKQVSAVLRVEDAHDRAVRDIQGLYSMTPDGFFDRVIGDPLAAPTWALDRDRKELGWIWRTLAPIAQIVRRLPESAEAFSRGYQLSTNVRKMRDEALKPLGTDLTTLTMNKQTLKATTNTLENRKLTGVVDRWIELTQQDGAKKGKTQAIPSDDPRVQKLLSGLSLTERDQVDTLMQQRLMSTQHMQNQILEKGLQISSTRGGSLLQKMVGGKLSTNVSLASDLLNAFTADRSDPIAARAADMKMTQVQNQLTPEAFYDLAKFTESAAAEWTKYKEWFQENPDWASAQRYGKYIAEYKSGGKMRRVGVDNRQEAESLAKGAPITSFKLNRQDDPDKPPYLGPDAVGTINFLREKQQVQIDILRNRGVISDQEGVEMLKRYSPVEQLATEETYRRGALGLTPQPRRLTKLSEEHPWLQNHFSWVTKTANYWSRQLLREQVRAHLLDPEIAQNKELSNLIRDHYDNMLKPDSAIGRFMQKAASTWFMGLNTATALVNGTQPFLTHVAEFTSMTGKPLNSYNRVLRALGEAVSGGLRRTWKTQDHEWLMEQAANDGIRDLSMHDEQAATQETLSTNFKRAMQRNKIQTTGQRLGTMAGTFSNVGLWMFRQVERLNNDAALLASFDYYRESQPNLSRDEAYAKAKDFNSAVNYGGGAAQRPIGLYKGVPRTLAMLSTAMQTYTLGSSFQLARYIRAGLFRPDGLTPHEVYSARKAAVQMLGTQFALAGVLGLPFVSSAIAALDKAFPDLEVNKHLREWMHQIAGEDGENGNVLTDIGMTGIPSMMGWDVQSRLSMGNTVPGVSEINGFQPELLLGAPANMITNFVQGGQKLITGQPRAADAFVPPALKKIFQLFRNDFQALDYKNRPIFKPTTGEIAGMALGFQPKRLSDFNAASRIAALSQDNANRHEGQFHQQQAEEILRGNFGSVKQALLQRSSEDKAYDPVAAVRSIAGAAEELAFPRDLRREGTARSSDARSKLLSAFNLPPSQPSEADRYQFRSQVGQRLGLFSRSSTGLRQAQLMDELRKQQPEATRSELRQQVSRLSRGPSLQRTALLQE